MDRCFIVNGDSDSKGNPFLFLAACAVFMLSGIMLLAWLGSPPRSPTVGKMLPAMSLKPLMIQGSDPPDAQPKPGSAVVWYLWGPWDALSRETLGKISELSQRYKDHPRIEFKSVAFARDVLDVEQLRAEVSEFLRERGFPMPVFYDPEGKTSIDLALLMPFGSLGFPTTILADEHGKIILTFEGNSAEGFRDLEQFLSNYSGAGNASTR